MVPFRLTFPPLVAVAALALAVVQPSPAPAQGRPDCAVILRSLHDVTGHNGARIPDPVKVAKRLGVDAAWVERCAASYGRRLKRHEEERPVDTDSPLIETREEQEYEEVGREEKETAGDKYFTVIEEDELDRKRLKNFDADSRMEWEPFETHEWEPNTGREWEPFLLDDDDGF